ncbi:DUF2795 domain-containing protein [Caballeronia sp. LZ065]|uniref:DUF2795 domain-containing protein n=1 Tax=Caballeronia sp. LZ065 TaxID=3038571 RepID=UPI0028561B7E|nr:DUF2795 domain-containing protein [Caballeronia sp. LZ065]MDR5781212.1 DUF2795 domain-containing protein [Caballeronia sp. LZ065]
MVTDKSSGGHGPVFIEIQKALKGIAYPADKQTVVETARKAGADEAVMSALESLQERQFVTPADISKAVGQEED